jgi:phosphoglycolate phosphatase-like HAD superfamily hydrolase
VLLIDLDGTLVDSEDLNHRAFVQIVREFHLEDRITKVMEGLITGRDFAGIMSDIGLDEKTRKMMEKRMDEIVRSADLHIMPHAAEAMRLLAKRGVKFSIATLNLSKRALEIMKLNKMDDMFEPQLIVGSDSLPWEKPNPKVVFEVLRRAGRSRAIVVGNAPRDVMLAKNCDLPVIYLKQAMPQSKALSSNHESAAFFEGMIHDLESRYDHNKIFWGTSWSEIPAIVDKILAEP